MNKRTQSTRFLALLMGLIPPVLAACSASTTTPNSPAPAPKPAANLTPEALAVEADLISLCKGDNVYCVNACNGRAFRVANKKYEKKKVKKEDPNEFYLTDDINYEMFEDAGVVLVRAVGPDVCKRKMTCSSRLVTTRSGAGPSLGFSEENARLVTKITDQQKQIEELKAIENEAKKLKADAASEVIPATSSATPGTSPAPPLPPAPRGGKGPPPAPGSSVSSPPVNQTLTSRLEDLKVRASRFNIETIRSKEALTNLRIQGEAENIEEKARLKIEELQAEITEEQKETSRIQKSRIHVIDECEVDVPEDVKISRVQLSIQLASLANVDPKIPPAASSSAGAASQPSAQSPSAQSPSAQPPPAQSSSAQSSSAQSSSAQSSSAQSPPARAREMGIDWQDFEPQPPQLKSSLAFNVDHGKFYYDVGMLLAVVPKGKRSISNSSDGRLATSEQTAQRTLVHLSVWPWGHRRGVMGPLAGRAEWQRRLLDALHISVGLKGALDLADQEILLGLGLETVTGFSLEAGYAIMKGDSFLPGYGNGGRSPADLSTARESRYMGQLYFGLGFGFEIARTLIPKVTQEKEAE